VTSFLIVKILFGGLYLWNEKNIFSFCFDNMKAEKI